MDPDDFPVQSANYTEIEQSQTLESKFIDLKVGPNSTETVRYPVYPDRNGLKLTQLASGQDLMKNTSREDDYETDEEDLAACALLVKDQFGFAVKQITNANKKWL